MGKIENIFSKKRTAQPKKPKIIIDTREKQSLVASFLIEKGAEISFEKLDIGDYIAGDVVVERKAFSDLISSMMNKRLQKQLANLKKYRKGILLIEGFDFHYNSKGIHENALRGLLVSVAADFKIPVVYTKDEEDTAKFLIVMAKRRKNALGTRHFKDMMTLDEKKMFVLEGFPGIGPTIAKRLIQNFKTLKDIFNADEKALENIEKFDKTKREKFKQVLEG